MFGSVLVVLDGSPSSESTVRLAAGEAKRHGASLVLVRLIPRPEAHAHVHLAHGGPALIPCHLDDPSLSDAERDADRYLDQVVRRHALPNTTVRVVATGDPFRRMVEEIERRRDPLVVIATDSTNGDRGHRLGELAHRLLLLGIVPVLAVRAGLGTTIPAALPELPHPPIDIVVAESLI